MIRRVRKSGEFRAVVCAETGERVFGRTVWKDLESGDLAVIISMPTGDVLVDLVTFTESHRYFENVERFCL